MDANNEQNQSQVLNRFIFEHGHAMFDGVDLDLSPKHQKMLKKMVANLGRVVPYTEFNKHYSSANPGKVLKDKLVIVKKLKEHNVPYVIEAKTGQGYLIRAHRT